MRIAHVESIRHGTISRCEIAETPSIQARILAQHCSRIMGITWLICSNLMIVRVILTHPIARPMPLSSNHAAPSKG
jgi:hypothetical protein